MGRFESVVSRVVNYLGKDKWSASITSNVLWYYVEFRHKGEPSMVGVIPIDQNVTRRPCAKIFSILGLFLDSGYHFQMFRNLSVRN